MRVLRLTIDDAQTLARVGEHEIFVSDIVDQGRVPDAKMTVGFARVRRRLSGDCVVEIQSHPRPKRFLVIVETKGARRSRGPRGAFAASDERRAPGHISRPEAVCGFALRRLRSLLMTPLAS